jgi:hypothetical protein
VLQFVEFFVFNELPWALHFAADYRCRFFQAMRVEFSDRHPTAAEPHWPTGSICGEFDHGI